VHIFPFVARPLESFGVHSTSDNIEFSGDFRPCSAEDSDEDCDVISGSGETATWHSSTSGHQRFEYIEQTSTRPEMTSQDGGRASTSGEPLVIVVEMTERSPSRHAGRPFNPTDPAATAAASELPSTATRRRPSYRLRTTTTAPVPLVIGAVGGPAVAERVAINVGLIVGIVGAVSTLVVMLAALLLCRPRPHIAQAASTVAADVGVDHKLKLASNGDRRRHNVVVHASNVGLACESNVACRPNTGARVSSANEWFV